MKKAIIGVQTVVNPWKPPFLKNVEEKELEVMEGDSFDSMEKVRGNIFKLIKCDGNNCIIQYSNQFTLKGYEHPGNKQVTIGPEPVSFTYLWGSDGITKRVSVKKITEA